MNSILPRVRNSITLLLLFTFTLVSSSNSESISSSSSSSSSRPTTSSLPKAQNQFDKEELHAHLQYIREFKASQPSVVESNFREYPKPGDDTRKKQEVVIDPTTGNLIDVETGDIIPM